MSTTLPISDKNGVQLTSVEAHMAIEDGTPLEVFISDARVYEGDDTPTAVVHLNLPHTEDVTLNYTIDAQSGDSATAGSDFTATTGSITILAGFTSETITLPVLSDSVLEASETFSITLDSPSAGAFARDTAQIEIIDSSRTIETTGEVGWLSAEAMEKSIAAIIDKLEANYNAYASDNDATWRILGDNLQLIIDSIIPGLRVVTGIFFETIG